MAATAFNTTTLSEALDSSVNEFTVASTANITAGDLLVIRDEVFKVQSVPSSGRVKGIRGVQGSEARAHKSGQRVFIIQNNHDLKQTTKGQLAVVGASGTYPDFLFPGQRARDGAGNEFILCEFSAVTYTGTTVLISNDGNFNATVVTLGDQGSVGVTVEEMTSDQYGWVQIYGYNAYCQEVSGDSGVSSGYLACVTTVNSTPDVGMVAVAPTTFTSATIQHGQTIRGMFIVGASSSLSGGTSSAASFTGSSVPVFLNYPWVHFISTPIIQNATSANFN